VSRELLLKITIAIAGAFVGWVLAQLTGWLKGWFYRFKVRRLLLQELKDLDAGVGRLYFHYARQLEIHGAHCVSAETMVGLSHPIFSYYYKDAVLSLNQKQRISYQLIHLLVDAVNDGIDALRQESSEIYAANSNSGMTEALSKRCAHWGDIAKSQFMNCASLQWQVRFHLANERSPDLSPNTEHHKDYLAFLQEMQEKADKFVANGKTIDRNKFNVIYDPSRFQGSSP